MACRQLPGHRPITGLQESKSQLFVRVVHVLQSCSYSPELLTLLVPRWTLLRVDRLLKVLSDVLHKVLHRLLLHRHSLDILTLHLGNSLQPIGSVEIRRSSDRGDAHLDDVVRLPFEEYQQRPRSEGGVRSVYDEVVGMVGSDSHREVVLRDVLPEVLHVAAVPTDDGNPRSVGSVKAGSAYNRIVLAVLPVDRFDACRGCRGQQRADLADRAQPTRLGDPLDV